MKTSDLKAPCKDCKDRHDGCHSECEAYIKYSAARKAFNEWKRDLAKADSMEATRGERIKRNARRKLGGAKNVR